MKKGHRVSMHFKAWGLHVPSVLTRTASLSAFDESFAGTVGMGTSRQAYESITEDVYSLSQARLG